MSSSFLDALTGSPVTDDSAFNRFKIGAVIRARNNISCRAASLLVFALALTAGCKREQRRFRETPPAATAANLVTMSELQPGPSVVEAELRNPYEDNAYAVSEGKRLFDQITCPGCHSHGGGGIGPPLTDDEWIYGSAPQNIFSTIVEGRPNGMPSFRGRLPNYQIWQLVAYVRALGGLQGK